MPRVPPDEDARAARCGAPVRGDWTPVIGGSLNGQRVSQQGQEMRAVVLGTNGFERESYRLGRVYAGGPFAWFFEGFL